MAQRLNGPKLTSKVAKMNTFYHKKTFCHKIEYFEYKSLSRKKLNTKSVTKKKILLKLTRNDHNTAVYVEFFSQNEINYLIVGPGQKKQEI